jgi:uncharacterized protein YqfB (UPF0267 family)
MITVNVPRDVSITHFYVGNRVYMARAQDGRLVMDVEVSHFQSLLRGEHGQLWAMANQEAIALLAAQSMAVQQPR